MQNKETDGFIKGASLVFVIALIVGGAKLAARDHEIKFVRQMSAEAMQQLTGASDPCNLKHEFESFTADDGNQYQCDFVRQGNDVFYFWYRGK
jgi:hypothetical protein